MRSPAISSWGANLLSETVGTFLLVMASSAIVSKKVAITGPAAALAPYLIGVLVWAIGLSLGGPTGYAINPARDLGPRIAHTFLPLGKKGDSNLRYAPVPIVGPFFGAALAAIFVRLVHM
jgi:glycerol uptake facilitator protein